MGGNKSIDCENWVQFIYRELMHFANKKVSVEARM